MDRGSGTENQELYFARGFHKARLGASKMHPLFEQRFGLNSVYEICTYVSITLTTLFIITIRQFSSGIRLVRENVSRRYVCEDGIRKPCCRDCMERAHGMVH